MSKVVAVIPAAGKGSRLGSDGPKIFTPITPSVTPWTILRSALFPLVDHIEIVLAPPTAKVYSRALEGLGVCVGISEQSEPRGMGNAVFCADWHDADTIVVVWGDQIGINKDTVADVLQEHGPVWCDQCRDDHIADRRIMIPVVWMANPYVEYIFEETLLEVREQREGDRTDHHGFSDVGVFVLSTRGLRDAWLDYLKAKPILGYKTNEVSFLRFLVWLSYHGWEVTGTVFENPDEARGLNTPEDLEWARERFAK